MNWGAFLRREWGAATFVVTVAAGLVVVPVALAFGNQAPAPVDIPVPSAAPSIATTAATSAATTPATGAATTTPRPSPS